MRKETERRNDSMRVQVLHDEQGNILSFAVIPEGFDGGLNLVPKEKQSTKILDFPTKKGEKFSSQEDYKNLVERVKQYKVDNDGKEARLIRK
jgi:hypothetical protein